MRAHQQVSATMSTISAVSYRDRTSSLKQNHRGKRRMLRPVPWGLALRAEDGSFVILVLKRHGFSRAVGTTMNISVLHVLRDRLSSQNISRRLRHLRHASAQLKPILATGSCRQLEIQIRLSRTRNALALPDSSARGHGLLRSISAKGSYWHRMGCRCAGRSRGIRKGSDGPEFFEYRLIGAQKAAPETSRNTV